MSELQYDATAARGPAIILTRIAPVARVALLLLGILMTIPVFSVAAGTLALMINEAAAGVVAAGISLLVLVPFAVIAWAVGALLEGAAHLMACLIQIEAWLGTTEEGVASIKEKLDGLAVDVETVRADLEKVRQQGESA